MSPKKKSRRVIGRETRRDVLLASFCTGTREKRESLDIGTLHLSLNSVMVERTFTQVSF